MRYFDTRFMNEADEFIAQLDLKTAKKIFYIIDLVEQTNDLKFSRNYRMTFGNLERNLRDFRLDFSLFGTRRTIKIHLLLRHMVL